MPNDLDDTGYPLSASSFRKWIADKVESCLKRLASQNISERDSDFARGQIKAWSEALEAFNNKK